METRRTLSRRRVTGLLAGAIALAACGAPPSPPTAAPTSVPAKATVPPTVAAPTTAPTVVPTVAVAPATPAAAVPATPAAAGKPTAAIVEVVRRIEMARLARAAMTRRGDLFYGADFLANVMYKFDRDGKVIQEWGSAGSEPGQFRFRAPRPPFRGYVAIGPQGDVYVSDSYNHRVQKFDANGKLLTIWGREGTGDGEFNGAGPITIDGQGNLIISDMGNGRIQHFDPNGKFLGAWGSKGNGEGQFTEPADVEVDSQGNYYVVDIGANKVNKFTSARKFVLRWGEQGERDGQFDGPGGLVIDRRDHIYVSDEPGRFQKFDVQGTFLGSWRVPLLPGFDVMVGGLVGMDEQGNLYHESAGIPKDGPPGAWAIHILRPIG
jgi:DNA-binding beta-propeller fold protein YncE